jgi:uncharacterized secreted repeat protein (TIGR03808 family)
MLNRRRFLCAGVAVGASTHVVARAGADPLAGVELGSMRGSIDAIEFGIGPGTPDDLGAEFARMLHIADEQNMPVFLPPGEYRVSNISLPRRVRLSGVPGATRIVYGGGGHLMVGEDAEHIAFTGLVLDGAGRGLADDARGLVEMQRVGRLVIDNCSVVGGDRHGIALERCSGRIERCAVSGAADAGIYSVDGGSLQIAGNTISDCGNGGILVHRWHEGEDGTMITGNRVGRIGAIAGGTGQYGNGINIFRAATVVVAGNIVTDCAFSAIRANSASNVQITGNTCLRSGETAVYAEFSFEGAVIASNIVDGAANGVSIVNFNEGGRMAVCSGNVIRNLTSGGPYPPDPPGFGAGIDVEADCSVTGNVIEGAPLHGIGIGWGAFMRNVVASGNVIRKSGRGIAVSVVEGTGAAIISDNIIDGAKNGAVVGFRWADPATGDLAIIGAGDHPNLTVERNRVS